MKKYEVACYHWSNWHPYGQNDLKRGKGWTEWEYLKGAIPRFVGHRQPRKPLWGYFDDSDPEIAALQIDAAAGHGIDAFIFDWGWSADDGFGGHGNNLALERGFMKAANRDRLKFGLMWCGGYDIGAFDYIIEKYFAQPNYWRVDGGPYISIYEMDKFVAANGGLDAAAEKLAGARAKAERAGLGKVHFAAIEFGLRKDVAEWVEKLSVDSVTSYAWCHNALPKGGLYGAYKDWAREAMDFWPVFEKKFGVPYFPSVSVGWDPSPRCFPDRPYKIGGPLQYHCLDGTYEIACEPYLSSIVVDNTPEAFKCALAEARGYMDRVGATNRAYVGAKNCANIVTLYAWNEWTEGAYLEPDDQYGMGYLEAVRDVFGG